MPKLLARESMRWVLVAWVNDGARSAKPVLCVLDDQRMNFGRAVKHALRTHNVHQDMQGTCFYEATKTSSIRLLGSKTTRRHMRDMTSVLGAPHGAVVYFYKTQTETWVHADVEYAVRTWKRTHTKALKEAIKAFLKSQRPCGGTRETRLVIKVVGLDALSKSSEPNNHDAPSASTVCIAPTTSAPIESNKPSESSSFAFKVVATPCQKTLVAVDSFAASSQEDVQNVTDVLETQLVEEDFVLETQLVEEDFIHDEQDDQVVATKSNSSHDDQDDQVVATKSNSSLAEQDDQVVATKSNSSHAEQDDQVGATNSSRTEQDDRVGATKYTSSSAEQDDQVSASKSDSRGAERVAPSNTHLNESNAKDSLFSMTKETKAAKARQKKSDLPAVRKPTKRKLELLKAAVELANAMTDETARRQQVEQLEKTLHDAKKAHVEAQDLVNELTNQLAS